MLYWYAIMICNRDALVVSQSGKSIRYNKKVFMLLNDRRPVRFTDIQPAYVNLWLTDCNDNGQAEKDQQFTMKYWSLSVGKDQQFPMKYWSLSVCFVLKMQLGRHKCLGKLQALMCRKF